MSTIACSVEACGSPAKVRGWCMKHYARVRKYGDPSVNLIGSGQSNIDRFMSHVEKSESGCWIWTASKFKSGYARFTPTGSKHPRYGHRWIYEHEHGPIKGRALMLHSCGTRACVNPQHLRPGTVLENSADSRKDGTLVQGERVHGVRLTEAQVLDIRAAWETDRYTIAGLARSYDVSVGCIAGVVKNINWKYLLPNALSLATEGRKPETVSSA